MKNKKTIILLVTAIGFFSTQLISAQNDTIRVMAYNTLGFGPGSCQTPSNGEVSTEYPYLKAIFQYAKPDVIGLDKMQCLNTNASDHQGITPYTFPDTVISECFASNYSYCSFTDVSGCSNGDGSVLFYNTTKLGYVSTKPIYSGTEDFDLFKLYYKDPDLSATHDTTFLYIILCHTISGSSSTGRDGQATTVINALKTMFTHTPNLIYMGDFNTHSSSEPGYELITQTSDTSFILNDPPFHPDSKLTYPINWSSSPNLCPAYLTTTTRASLSPNSCGTTGGAMDWYDHIFLSPWIINNNDYIHYIRDSYTTLGNNGNLIGQSVNTGSNTSVPSNVTNALYNFSDKYPVMVSLAITNHILGFDNLLLKEGSIKINNPISNGIVIHFAEFMNGQNISMEVYDVCGRSLYNAAFAVNSLTINKDISLTPGIYFIRFISGGYSTTIKVVKE